MMTRTQITLDSEVQKRARRRASELGVSLAEYFRRVIARDLGRSEAKADIGCVFDLGSSGGADIAKRKDEMIARAFTSSSKGSR